MWKNEVKALLIWLCNSIVAGLKDQAKTTDVTLIGYDERLFKWLNEFAEAAVQETKDFFAEEIRLMNSNWVFRMEAFEMLWGRYQGRLYRFVDKMYRTVEGMDGKAAKYVLRALTNRASQSFDQCICAPDSFN
ncbi:MAG: hypothetical protein IJ855_04350 [Bacteroidales bacterium]|nr:hypothetical protein [Bacteroidales bacterium]